MTRRFVSMRNLRFLLYEVFDAESLTGYPYFHEHSREVFDLILDTGLKMGTDLLYPVLAEMDRNPPASSTAKFPCTRQSELSCGLLGRAAGSVRTPPTREEDSKSRRCFSWLSVSSSLQPTIRPPSIPSSPPEQPT